MCTNGLVVIRARIGYTLDVSASTDTDFLRSICVFSAWVRPPMSGQAVPGNRPELLSQRRVRL